MWVAFDSAKTDHPVINSSSFWARFELGCEVLGCSEAIGIVNEFGNLSPVDDFTVGIIEEHTKPIA
jgi:hypothetical protein